MLLRFFLWNLWFQWGGFPPFSEVRQLSLSLRKLPLCFAAELFSDLLVLSDLHSKLWSPWGSGIFLLLFIFPEPGIAPVYTQWMLNKHFLNVRMLSPKPTPWMLTLHTPVVTVLFGPELNCWVKSDVFSWEEGNFARGFSDNEQKK